jgi:hypothetical protein
MRIDFAFLDGLATLGAGIYRNLNYYNYFTEIEDTFIRRRGKNLFLSPLDWALIESWQDRGVPLHIVIRSIESVFDVFDHQPPGTRSIKSLLYCKEEIESQYVEWLAAHAGRSDDEAEAVSSGYSLDAIREHILDATAKLESIEMESLREELQRAMQRLRGLEQALTDDPETIDGTLSDIEKLLERAMLSNWDRQHLKMLEKEVASQLRAYKAEMDAESYKNTFQLMLLKRLREEAGIPRLGLYYL